MDSFLRKFGDLKKHSQVEQLHSELGPYMLRRTKEIVETDIPKKEEVLVEIELTNIQKTYYKVRSEFSQANRMRQLLAHSILLEKTGNRRSL